MGHDQTMSQGLPHMDTVFTVMDMDGDGVITKEEFFTYCYNTHTVRQSLEVLP